ncbi:hypothetical protein N7539_004368 [Penicillium diatomitis]|uniref:Major facilitator superfamily (MFS) profile domain-containing protein n=1 Tax=Penicillium diatomitis TaxID=2819901 RepID=A0A9X0BYJ6_9EURO|nr:uncharacterized protein N7539_004368 [Penicillium diatomitis]KAJ5489478.1 hypothetical protein N7539_004368 [Penicillium diatomitis]
MARASDPSPQTAPTQVQSTQLSVATDDEIDSKPHPHLKAGHHLPLWRKCLILFVVSWMTLLVTFSSTSLLTAIPEIANDLSTTREILNIVNAGVLIAMGFSSFIWGPISQIVGRRHAYNSATLVLCACSAGAAVSTNLHSFVAMRVLCGLTGTFFMVAGQTIIADIFRPTVRGTAVGLMMAGSVSGPAIGPCVGGVIVTFSQWRVIYWLQFGMTLFGLILSLIIIPDITRHRSQSVEKRPISLFYVVRLFNPLHVFRPFIYPNVVLCHFTCGLLATFQYGFLTSARSIFNPRFHLQTPLVSGLFYLSPGLGFLIGSIVGGKLSDRAVKQWIKKRNGTRLPQDRLNSGLVNLFVVLPSSTLIYAWTLQQEVGGMAVPIISAFAAGVGLLGTFNGLNTYSAEVIPQLRFQVISGKYVMQYAFAAAATASVEPSIGCIGVGWTFTIYVFLALLGGLCVCAIIRWGFDMQRWVERTFDVDEKPSSA